MNYNEAIRYARKVSFSSVSHEDAVHDAWLVHYNSTGKDLFDEHPGFVMKAIKWRIFDKTSKGYIDQGKLRVPQFIEVDESHQLSNDSPTGPLLATEYHTKVRQTLLAYTSANKYGKKINPEILVAVCDKLEQGYSQSEIAKQLGISQQSVNQHKRKIQTLIRRMDMISSPFNGNPLPIKEKITRNYYEKHKEKFSEYTYDTDHYADSNEWFLQLVHKSHNYGLLIVEGKSKDL